MKTVKLRVEVTVDRDTVHDPLFGPAAVHDLVKTRLSEPLPMRRLEVEVTVKVPTVEPIRAPLSELRTVPSQRFPLDYVYVLEDMRGNFAKATRKVHNLHEFVEARLKGPSHAAVSFSCTCFSVTEGAWLKYRWPRDGECHETELEEFEAYLEKHGTSIKRLPTAKPVTRGAAVIAYEHCESGFYCGSSC